MRAFCVVVAAALLAARLVFIAPSMNHDLRAYWNAAANGETEAAERHRAAFDARHPTAARLFNTTLVLLLVWWMWGHNRQRNRSRVPRRLPDGRAPEGLHLPSPSPWPLVGAAGAAGVAPTLCVFEGVLPAAL